MRCRDDRGSATIWALAWLFMLTTLAQVVMLLAAVVARQHHADAAADMSALSAAQRLQRGGDACAAAERVAAAHETSVTRCSVEGDDVRVEIQARMEMPLGLSFHLRGVARAGP
jgi:secretion/DNA translocation related TadE-like protein